VIVNGSNLPVVLHEVRISFHHIPGAEVVERLPRNDGWRFARRSGWRTAFPRLWWSYVRRQRLPDLDPGKEAKGSWTFLQRLGRLSLEPDKEMICPLPQLNNGIRKEEIGVQLLVAFTDTAGRNWWRTWPSGELRSVWDSDLWSPRRRRYINGTLEIVPTVLIALAITAMLVSAPIWSIIASWVAFFIFAYVAWILYRNARNFPAQQGSIAPEAPSLWSTRRTNLINAPHERQIHSNKLRVLNRRNQFRHYAAIRARRGRR
jgi:hypothetical protein